MSTTKRATNAARSSARDPFIQITAIIERLEARNEDPHSAYRLRIETGMEYLLASLGGTQAASEAMHLRKLLAGGVLEEAARHMGFCLGVEYARREAAKGAK